MHLSQKCSKDYYTIKGGSFTSIGIDAENANIQLKRRISELLQNSRNSKMSRHHTDPSEDLERMDSDELLTTIRNTSMQMSIDIITKATTPDKTRQARELRER